MGFQKSVNGDLPIGVAGDFASTNPYASVIAGEGGLIVGDEPVTVGNFAWADDEGVVSPKKVDGGVLGFVGRSYTATILEHRVEASMEIPAGTGITLLAKGDFFAFFEDGAEIGQKVLASEDDGHVKAADDVEGGYIDTGYTVASKAEAGRVAKITKQ